ncbi:MAG: SLC13 family permease [Christensenellales bacterium]
MRRRQEIIRMMAAGIGLFLLFGADLLPVIPGLPVSGQRVLGLFVGAVTLWLFVDIGWPSALVIFALGFLPGVKTGDVITASFGNSTVWFLIFSFLLTYALKETGFLRRVAMLFITSRMARRGPWAFAFMFLLSVLALGSFIAPTVTFLLFFALHREAMEALGQRPGDALAKALMIGIACVTSISCAMTPIAHTFPLMALGFHEAATGERISYLSYLKIGLPAGLLLFGLTFALLYMGFHKRVKAQGLKLDSLTLQPPGKPDARELFSALVFFLVVMVWLFSGILPEALKPVAALGTAWPALLGVILLSAIPIAGKPVLDLKEGFARGLNWQSLLLCAAALALGKYLTLPEYGVTDWFGAVIAAPMGAWGYVGALAVIIAATVIMTNFLSNIVTTTVMYQVAVSAIPVLALSGIVIDPALSAVLVGLCASLAYATPPAIAHIALAAGSGWADSRDMLVYGGALALLSIPVVLAFALV